MPPRSKFHVLVADRLTLFAEGLAGLLRDAPGIAKVSTATTVEAVEHALRTAQPDVVLFAPGLGGPDVLADARRLTAALPAGRVAFVDDRVRPLHVRIALEVNAGYWTKHANLTEILRAIRAAAAGRRTFCPDVGQHLLETCNGLRLKADSPLGALARLSPREFEVFLHLARGSTARECARVLGASENTVDIHRGRIKAKLGLHRAVDLALLAIQEGMLP